MQSKNWNQHYEGKEIDRRIREEFVVHAAVPIRSGSRAAASSVANEVVGQRLRAPRCGEAVSWAVLIS